MITGSIEECLVAWALAAILLVWSQWRWGRASTGIPVAYFMGLAIIHVPGAILYLDPTYEFYDRNFIETGFQISTIGIVGFAAGVLLGGTQARPFRRSASVMYSSSITSKLTASEINRLAWFLLLFGVAVQFVIAPALKSLPLTALLSGLSQLMVAGACLGLYAGRMSADRALLRKWLIVACAFPIVTLVGSAFLGYGVYALLVVVSFALALFRPRLWSVIPFAIALYIGLSVFVTYSRDRNEYRAAAWYEGATLEQRVDRVINTFVNFELVDLSNAKHRASIDERLNQNDLVGAAEAHIDSGRVEFAYGETFWTALVAPIPRILWPGKPEFGGSGNIAADFTGYSFADDTSVGVGQVLEFFINFGWKGEFWCFVLFGAICRRLDMHAGIALSSGDLKHFLLFFLPSMGMLQSGGALAEVVASVAGSFFSALVAVTLAERYLTRIRTRTSRTLPML